jgi:hypothetical protein
MLDDELLQSGACLLLIAERQSFPRKEGQSFAKLLWGEIPGCVLNDRSGRVPKAQKYTFDMSANGIRERYER